MRFLLPCFALAVVTAAAPTLTAQEPGPAPGSGQTPLSTPPGPPKFLNQNVRIDVTISLKGDAKPLTKNLSMVASDGRETKGRAGIEIPVTTAPSTFQVPFGRRERRRHAADHRCDARPAAHEHPVLDGLQAGRRAGDRSPASARGRKKCAASSSRAASRSS